MDLSDAADCERWRVANGLAWLISNWQASSVMTRK